MGMKTVTALDRAIELSGGMGVLARAISTSPNVVANWKYRGAHPHPRYCPAIEQITGGRVSRKDLRPDDWSQIWPELAKKRLKDTTRG